MYDILQAAVLFSIPWSIAAVADSDGKQKFNIFFKELISGKNESLPIPESIGKLETVFPEVGTVHDFCFEVKR